MKEMGILDPVTLACALGCGLIAGLFFAFSTCVMKSLGTLPPEHGIAAMQSINVVILNPLFLSVFMGTAVACLFTAVVSVMNWSDSGAAYLLAGSLLYLVGSLGVTMVFNVPRNNALAAVIPASAEGAALWRDYLSTWTSWNHVRGIASLVAMASFIIALRLRA
jgi:uncharacterized membrane protein